MNFSIVTAAYNAAPFLNDFFESLTKQKGGFFCKKIQLICVDDGSTDNTAQIIKQWRSRYPDIIEYYHQKNNGQAVARNTGLKYVKSEWVTFLDSDDFISKDYFYQIDLFLKKQTHQNINMVSCNVVFFDEKSATKKDTHPLRYRFSSGNSIIPNHQLNQNIQLSVNSVFFKASIISEKRICFDSRVRPSFEDGKFVAEYLRNLTGYTAFLSQAIYYYRKRQKQTSTLDNSWQCKERYKDQIKYGYIELLESYQENVPIWLQNTILYDISYHFKRYLGNKNINTILTKTEVAEYLNLLKKLFSFISSKTITDFPQDRFPYLYKVGILNLFKGETSQEVTAFLVKVDTSQGLIKARLFDRNSDLSIELLINGLEVKPLYTKVFQHIFCDEVFCNEIIIWFNASIEDEITIIHNNKVCELKNDIPSLTQNKIGKLLTSSKIIKKLSYSSFFKYYFNNAWVFIDKPSEANDNAEHFYRYIKLHHPEINIFFLLRKRTSSWRRLKVEGFNLIDYGSLLHKLLLLNAKFLISSHADTSVISSVSQRLYQDALHYKFIFLQHGVINQDLSSWINQLPIDLMVTSTKREYLSIVANNNSYNLTSKEVILSGLPRHDNLLHLKKNNTSHRNILIMPTWRRNLVGAQARFNNTWDTVDNFENSLYAKQWVDLISSERLIEISKKYSTFFILHPNMEEYSEWFSSKVKSIQVFSFQSINTFQEILANSSVFITDYSSLAFDAAVIDIPTIYYQFDSQFLSSGHTYTQGYFDYENEGFGPVATSTEKVLNELIKILQNNADPIYHIRRRKEIGFTDGENSQRLFRALAQDAVFANK